MAEVEVQTELQVTVRGETVTEALAEARRQFPDHEIRVVKATRLRRGGVGGFFAKDLGVELVVEPERAGEPGSLVENLALGDLPVPVVDFARLLAEAERPLWAEQVRDVDVAGVEVSGRDDAGAADRGDGDIEQFPVVEAFPDVSNGVVASTVAMTDVWEAFAVPDLRTGSDVSKEVETLAPDMSPVREFTSGTPEVDADVDWAADVETGEMFSTAPTEATAPTPPTEADEAAEAAEEGADLDVDSHITGPAATAGDDSGGEAEQPTIDTHMSTTSAHDDIDMTSADVALVDADTASEQPAPSIGDTVIHASATVDLSTEDDVDTPTGPPADVELLTVNDTDQRSSNDSDTSATPATGHTDPQPVETQPITSSSETDLNDLVRSPDTHLDSEAAATPAADHLTTIDTGPDTNRSVDTDQHDNTPTADVQTTPVQPSEPGPDAEPATQHPVHQPDPGSRPTDHTPDRAAAELGGSPSVSAPNVAAPIALPETVEFLRYLNVTVEPAPSQPATEPTDSAQTDNDGALDLHVTETPEPSTPSKPPASDPTPQPKTRSRVEHAQTPDAERPIDTIATMREPDSRLCVTDEPDVTFSADWGSWAASRALKQVHDDRRELARKERIVADLQHADNKERLAAELAAQRAAERAREADEELARRISAWRHSTQTVDTGRTTTHRTSTSSGPVSARVPDVPAQQRQQLVALDRLGLPQLLIEQVTRGMSLRETLEGLRYRPGALTDTDGIVTVIGSRGLARKWAKALADTCPQPCPIVVAAISTGEDTDPDVTVHHTPVGLRDWRCQEGDSTRTRIVVIEVPSLASHQSFARAVIDACKPRSVRLVVTADDVEGAEGWLRVAPDAALDVVGFHRSRKPGRILELGAPIATLEGRQADANLWADMLWERTWR